MPAPGTVVRVHVVGAAATACEAVAAPHFHGWFGGECCGREWGVRVLVVRARWRYGGRGGGVVEGVGGGHFGCFFCWEGVGGKEVGRLFFRLGA